MKRCIYVFCIVFLIFIFLYSSIVQAVDNIQAYQNDNTGIVKFDDCKIVSWMQLKKLQLTLPNGSTIAKLNTNNTMKTKKITKTIDIVFILDVSGSMSGKRLETLKSSTKKIIKNLSSKFDETNMNKLRISIISYSSDISTLFTFKECTNENLANIYDKIDSLNANGSTKTGAAINEAKNMWINSKNEAEFKYTILITDGAPTDTTTKSDLENFKKELSNINFLTILIGLSSNYDSLFEASDNIQHTGNSNFEDEIVNGIYNFIFWYFIDVGSLVSIKESQGIISIENNTDYQALLDAELFYGSMLEVEYNVVVKSTEPIDKIKIYDYPSSDLKYSPSFVLLSENKKNDEFNWTYDSNNILTTIVSPSNEKKSDGSYKETIIKIIFKTLLSNESTFQNKADILVKTSSNTFTTKVAGQEPSMYSHKLIILPPYGGSNNVFIIYNLLIILSFLLVLFVKIKKSL